MLKIFYKFPWNVWIIKIVFLIEFSITFITYGYNIGKAKYRLIRFTLI